LDRSRLVLVETIYHQSPTEQPKSVDGSFSKELKGDEQVYGPRRMRLTEDWVPLDAGWIKDDGASLLLIQNEQPKFSRTLSKAQREEVESRVIEIGVKTGETILALESLPPGASSRFIYPLVPLGDFRVRGRAKEAVAFVTILPK